MTCSNETLMRINEILVDAWGGEVQLINVSPNLGSIMVNIKTPWGDIEDYEVISEGSSKTYTSGEKTYSVHMVEAYLHEGKYLARIYVCYEFIEKLDTILSMTYDSDASQTIEGEKLFFDVLLKSETGNVLDNFDVGIYINNIYIQDIPGDWRYEHIVTADDVGKTLSFQTKFNGTDGFNASMSEIIPIQIPGKVGTNLTINVDKTDIVVGETISFTGTLKDENNTAVPNKTLYLVYKTTNNQYTYVLDEDGYKIISSTNANGDYYRPWEPTIDYLDYNTYAMYFAGDSEYTSTYSPDILFNITIEKCIQNIKIQDQNYNLVANVEVTMNSITKVTNNDGLVSFDDIIKDDEYVVTKVYGEYSDEDTITGCKLDPQILHIVVPDEPTCVDYITQQECEDNGCYWWTSNDTCQSAPDGTTEYFDVYIKPYPFYEGNYEQAISKALEKVAELTGAISNYISSVTGYEYNGIDILEDANKEVIIVRVYLTDTGETSLVAPVIIAAIAGIIAGILLLSIGYVMGTSESDFTAEEVIELIDNSSDKAIEECKDRYPNRTTDVSEAANFKHCVGGIETVRIIGSADVVEEDSSEHIDYVINPMIIELDENLDNGTLLPGDIDDAINDNLTIPTKEAVDIYKEQAIDEECVFKIGNTCLLTKKALTTLVYVGAATGGVYLLAKSRD